MGNNGFAAEILRLGAEFEHFQNFESFNEAASSRESTDNGSFPDDGIVVEIPIHEDYDSFTKQWVMDIDDWLRIHNIRSLTVVSVRF